MHLLVGESSAEMGLSISLLLLATLSLFNTTYGFLQATMPPDHYWRNHKQHQLAHAASRQQPNKLELLDSGTTTPEPGLVNRSLVTDFPNPNINNAGHEITKILHRFFHQNNYDKRVRPFYSGPAALVNVSFHIIGISSVNEVQMDFTTDFYIRQKWFDPRLEFHPVKDIDELCVGAEFAEKIWLPDTFFANEKTARFHHATTENTFIRVGSNGRVYRSIRLTVTCSCPMDLQYFPMDTQRCKIEIESYGYNANDINYRWDRGNKSVSLDDKIELPQFKVAGFRMGHELQSLSSGDYIRLYCEIHFVRSMGYYLIQIYIPASLIVIISWVSFWLHRNATPARVALGVLTVLTMTTLMSSINSSLPKISYIKSIDVFLGTCFVMVFASLLEYASVGYIGKRIAMKRKQKLDLKQMQQHHQRVCLAAAAAANQTGTTTKTKSGQTTFNSLSARATNSPSNWLQQQPETPAPAPVVVAGAAMKLVQNSETGSLPVGLKLTTADQGEPKAEFEKQEELAEELVRICGLTPSTIDKYSRVVFPICFMCFNLMYWVIYGYISQQRLDTNEPPLIPFVRN